MKKSLFVVISLLLMISVFGCTTATQEQVNKSAVKNENADEKAEGKQFSIKVASYFAEDHPQTISLNKFKELVEQQTGGNVKVEIYPNSQLGSEDQYIPAVKAGTIQMGVTGTMVGREGAPLIAVAELPFLFDDWDHAQKVFTGEIGEEMAAPLLEKAGLRNLGWTVNGFREITSNKPIKSMKDFKGMRLRVPSVANYLEMAKALGTNPVPIPFSELFTALEQKVVDGQDNPYPTVVASKFYEVQKYALETRHMFGPALWVINEQFFQGLPKEYQDAVTNAAKEAVVYNWQISKEADDKAKQTLIEKGVEITVPDEAFKQQLRESQKPVEEWYHKEYPGSKELIEKIRAVK